MSAQTIDQHLTELQRGYRETGDNSQTEAWQCPGGSSAKVAASTTRSELTPNTLPCVSTTAPAPGPRPIAPVISVSRDLDTSGSLIPTSTDRMVDWSQRTFDSFEDLIIGLNRRTRSKLFSDCDSTCFGDLAGDLETRDSYFLIGSRDEPIGADQRFVVLTSTLPRDKGATPAMVKYT